MKDILSIHRYLSTKIVIKRFFTVFFCTFTMKKKDKYMNSTDKLFLLDAYALIYRAYYAFIKIRESTQRIQHFRHS